MCFYEFGKCQLYLSHILMNFAYKCVYTHTRWWGQMCMKTKVALSNQTERLQSNSGHCWIWRTINPAANRCLRPTAQRCAGKENCCVFGGWCFSPWKEGLISVNLKCPPSSSVVTATTEETLQRRSNEINLIWLWSVLLTIYVVLYIFE